MDPKSNDKCFIGDRPEEYADTWRWWSREDGGRDWSIAAVSRETPGSPRRWKRWGWFSSRASGEMLVMWAPWFQTSGLQNCERIHSYWFKLPRSWDFVSAALGQPYKQQVLNKCCPPLSWLLQLQLHWQPLFKFPLFLYWIKILRNNKIPSRLFFFFLIFIGV